jgi:hypothetical protein
MSSLAALPDVPELPILALLILILVGVAGRILWTLQRILKLSEARATGAQDGHWQKVEQHLASTSLWTSAMGDDDWKNAGWPPRNDRRDTEIVVSLWSREFVPGS